MTKSREAAYKALLSLHQDQRFLSDSLAKWANNSQPSSRDFALAQEIAYGVERRKSSLDYLARECAKPGKLPTKLKERLLIYLALYQTYFMDRIPEHAIVNETVELAKRSCHRTFVSYLNSFLRKLPKEAPDLPKGADIKSLSIRYSYPEHLVQTLIDDYSLKDCIEILNLGNDPAKVMMRHRTKSEALDSLPCLLESPFKVSILEDASTLKEWTQSSEVYIQNVTPASLIGELKSLDFKPRSILDLCASPGGKTIALHDLYPEALLHANDVSDIKCQRLQENLDKYHITAKVTESLGEELESEASYDLIILDVPCSNTGVLNKRPEARWRLSSESLADLKKIQLALFDKAITLASKGSYIYLMTCSILKSENEYLIKELQEKYSLELIFEKNHHANQEGWDGGFGALFRI